MTTNETTDWVDRCADEIHSVFAKNEHDIAWPPVNGTAAIIRQHAPAIPAPTDAEAKLAKIQTALDEYNRAIQAADDSPVVYASPRTGEARWELIKSIIGIMR